MGERLKIPDLVDETSRRVMQRSRYFICRLVSFLNEFHFDFNSSKNFIKVIDL